MPIKGLFKQNQNHVNFNKKIAELEKNYLKLNALEVKINRLVKLEEKIFPILKLKDEIIKAKKSGSSLGDGLERNIQEEKRMLEVSFLKKLTPLLEKVDSLTISLKNLEKEMVINRKVEKEILYRLAAIEEQLETCSQTSVKNEPITKVPLKESESSSFYESEQAILKRLAEIEGKLSTIKVENQINPPVVIKEIHIDKFYLDKYEQNNNIAQLGIKELSGALNIGATFGKDTVPKEISEQIVEDFKEMSAMKMNNKVDENDEYSEEDCMETESVKDAEEFTNIPIEEVNDEGLWG